MAHNITDLQHIPAEGRRPIDINLLQIEIEKTKDRLEQLELQLAVSRFEEDAERTDEALAAAKAEKDLQQVSEGTPARLATDQVIDEYIRVLLIDGTEFVARPGTAPHRAIRKLISPNYGDKSWRDQPGDSTRSTPA